jgi:hypothetical protein
MFLHNSCILLHYYLEKIRKIKYYSIWGRRKETYNKEKRNKFLG